MYNKYLKINIEVWNICKINITFRIYVGVIENIEYWKTFFPTTVAEIPYC